MRQREWAAPSRCAHGTPLKIENAVACTFRSGACAGAPPPPPSCRLASGLFLARHVRRRPARPRPGWQRDEMYVSCPLLQRLRLWRSRHGRSIVYRDTGVRDAVLQQLLLPPPPLPSYLPIVPLPPPSGGAAASIVLVHHKVLNGAVPKVRGAACVEPLARLRLRAGGICGKARGHTRAQVLAAVTRLLSTD